MNDVDDIDPTDGTWVLSDIGWNGGSIHFENDPRGGAIITFTGKGRRIRTILGWFKNTMHKDNRRRRHHRMTHGKHAGRARG